MHSRRVQKPSPSSTSTNSSNSFLRSATSCLSTISLLCFLNPHTSHVFQRRVNRIRNPTHRVGVRLGQPFDEVPVVPHPKASPLDVPRHWSLHLEVLQRTALATVSADVIAFLRLCVRVRAPLTVDRLTAYRVNLDPIRPPHLHNLRAIIENECDVLLPDDSGQLVEDFLLDDHIGTIVPVVTHQDVVERDGVSLQPCAGIIPAEIVTARDRTQVERRGQLTNPLRYNLVAVIQQNLVLFVRVPLSTVIRHGAVHVEQDPRATNQTRHEPTLQEGLPLHPSSGGRRRRRCVSVAHRKTRQILVLAADDFLTHHNALGYPASRARNPASDVPLNALLQRNIHHQEAQLNLLLDCKLFPLLPRVADAVRVVDDHVLARLESDTSPLHLPVANEVLAVLIPVRTAEQHLTHLVTVQADGLALRPLHPLHHFRALT